jgi:hypothetical protein
MSCIKPINKIIEMVITQSPSNNENDIINTLEIVMSGITSSNPQIPNYIMSSSTENICCTCNIESNQPYIYAYDETFLFVKEALGFNYCLDVNCCTNIFASVEEFLKYAEAVGVTGSLNQCKYDCCDFREKINQLLLLLDSGFVDEILDKGIVEVGDTNLNEIVDYFSSNSFSTNFYYDFMNILGDYGIVSACIDNIVFIFNADGYVSYLDN